MAAAGASISRWSARWLLSAVARAFLSFRSCFRRGTAAGFLSQHTWVDFRARVDDPVLLTTLVRAVHGEPPGPDAQDTVRETLATICPYRGLLYFREEDAPFFLDVQRPSPSSFTLFSSTVLWRSSGPRAAGSPRS